MPGRGGRGRGGRGGPLPRNVQVSKKISWLLRHGAEEEGLLLGPGGFLNVQDVLNNRKIKSLHVTFDELRAIVQDNDKQRFTMVSASSSVAEEAKEEKEEELRGETAPPQTPLPSSDPKDYLIRANQGHSIKVESEGLLQPIEAENMPATAVHGTTHSAWPLIVATGGLRPMGRNHVHFASGLPAGFTAIGEESGSGNGEKTAAPVISGMRTSSTVLMFLDASKALAAGLKFWRSDNGVILSEGNGEGIVPLELFTRVEDRTGEGVLLQDGKVVKETPASWAGKGNRKS